jgi:galactokinase/mevalonate kinase-like predicted kinase
MPKHTEGFKSRFAYSIIEHVNNNADVTQRVLKVALKVTGMDADKWPSLDISHQGDIPRCSTAFLVGVLHALKANALPGELAALAAHAKSLLCEYSAGEEIELSIRGGLRQLRSCPGYKGVFATPIQADDNLEQHLLLVYDPAKNNRQPHLQLCGSAIWESVRHSEDGLRAIQAGDWEKLGRAMDGTSRLTGGGSRWYAIARLSGAWGGYDEILIAPMEKHAEIKAALAAEGVVVLPVQFDNYGSSLIYDG